MITINDLSGACVDQVRLFARLFPDGASVTLDNCIAAARGGLDIDWAAENLLSTSAYKKYQEAKAPAEKAYQEAMAPAFCNAWDGGAGVRKNRNAALVK